MLFPRLTEAWVLLEGRSFDMDLEEVLVSEFRKRGVWLNVDLLNRAPVEVDESEEGTRANKDVWERVLGSTPGVVRWGVHGPKSHTGISADMKSLSGHVLCIEQ